MDLRFQLRVDTKPAADLMPALFEARKQLTLGPLSTGRLKHLLPVGEARVGSYEAIERICQHILLAFNTACFKECASRLKVRVLPNEVVRQ